MSRASRKPVEKDLDQQLQENFTSLISSLNSSTNIEGFFKDFLTREEKIMLGKRLMLHLMLEKGYKNDQIKAVLGISKETVRIHKLLWANGGEVYREIIKVIVNKNRNKEFWKKVDVAVQFMFKPVELLVKSRNDMRARAKLASGDWD